MQRRRIKVLYAFERRALTLTIGFFAIACSTYIYFVCLSIVNIIMRAEADRDIAALHTKISTLEARYIDGKETITLEMAEQRGFKKAPAKVYVTRTPANLVLSHNDES